jgi:uncharacterized protein YjbI with pentapeptide repeats
MAAPQLLRVGDLLLAGGPLSASDVDAGAIVELVQTTGDQVTVDTNRGKFVFDGDSDVTRKERPDRDEAETPFVPMTVTAAELRVGDMVVAGGGVPTDDTGWGDSSVVQEASANGDQTWMVRTETAEFKVPTESLLTVYHDVPDGTVVVDELDEHQRAVWAGIPEAVQERMTAPEMAGMGYDDEPMPAYRAAFFTNRRGVKVWHDPTTGKFAPTGYVSLRLLRRLWAGDTKAGMEFDDAVRKLRDREPDISYDAAVARLLGGASDRPLDRLYTDAAQRRMRRLWPATRPLDKPIPGPTMRRTDRSGLTLAQRPYRNAPAPTAASVDYLLASRQPALDGYLLGVGDDRFRLLSAGQALDGVMSGFAVDDTTGRFLRWDADRGDLSGAVNVRTGSGPVGVGDAVFYMGDAGSPVDTPWRVQRVSPNGTVLLRDESGVRPDTFVAADRVTPASISFDGPAQSGRVDPSVLNVRRMEASSVDLEPTRDSALVADLVGMNPGSAVQIGDNVYLKESTGDALVSGGFVNVADLSDRLSVGEAVGVIQSSPQSPLESVVDDNEVLEAVAEQLSARPLSPNEARARAVLDRVSGRQIDAVSASDRFIPPTDKRALRGADLSGRFLSGVDLSGYDLSGADLTESGLEGANLTGANLTGADLWSVDLTDANLTGADLTKANLEFATLRGSKLTAATLPGANLRDAYLNDVDLSGADLSGADLRNANLIGANLTDANLTGADLRNVADIIDADLTGANLTGARLPDWFVLPDATSPLDRLSGRQIDAVAARVIPMQPLPDTPEMREPGAVEEAAAELSRANPDVNVFVTSAGFGPGLYGSRSVLAADINQSSRDGYWRNGEFKPFTDAARQRADRISMREADAAALGRGGDGGQTLARQARRRQRLRNQYRRDLDIPSDERPVGTRVKLFGTRYTKQADGSWDGRRYDRETGTRTQSNISAAEYDALRVQKREQLDAVQSGQSVDALQVPEAVTDLIDRIRAVTGPVKGSPYRATPMRPGELLNEPGFMPEWEADALTRLVADEPADAQQIDALNIRESITDLIDRIRAVTGPIKDSPYNATPMRPGELMNEPGAMSEWEAEGIARLKKLGDYPASLPMDDVDLWAEIDFADFDDSSDVGPEARIQMPNSDERRVIDLAMTAGELHRGLPDFDRESRSYTDGPYALSWDATTARWTARRSLGNEDGPFVYGYSDDSAFDAMFDAGFKDDANTMFDGWLKAENSGVQIDAVSTIFETPERPMTDSEARIAVNQIGGWTIAAISGGRKSVENGRLVMPAGAGYQVRVSLAPDDTYSVERVFVRGTNVYPKGRIDGVYADQLSNVAYRAALYADGPFGEERRQVDAPPSAMSIDLLIGERRKQPKVGQALLEEPGAIGVVPTEATLEQILDAEQPAISAAFTIDFFDSQDPQMPLTRQFRVLTVRQTLDTTDDTVFNPNVGGSADRVNQLSGYAIDDTTGDVYRFTHSTMFYASDRDRSGTILTHLVKGEDVDGDGVLEFVDRTGGRPFTPPGAVYTTWPGELYGDADFRLYAAATQSAGVGVTPVGSRRNAAIDADASGRSFAFLMTSSNVDTVAELQQELQAFRPNNPSRQFSGADLKAGAVWFNRERSDITIDDIEAGVPTVEVIVGTNPDRALRHRLTVIAGIQLNDGRFALSGPPSTLYRTNVQQWERGRAGASWRRQVGRSWGSDDVAVVTGQVIGGADNPEGQVVLDPAPAVTIDAVNAEPVAIYEVGGAVRDDLMGIRSDDVDFAVTAPSYEAMKAYLEAEGFRIFQEKEEFVTIKAQVPEGNPLRERTNSADFVLARRDGPSSDGRRPDYTEPGSLEDDLERRDFTVNAIARDVDGNLIDPHGGQADIEDRVLRFVGDPEQRVREDGLRVLRGYRFMVTKGLTPEPATWAALTSPESAEMLKSVSKERVASELQKMFDYDTIGAVQLLGSLPDATLDAIFPEGVRLSPNMRKVKGATKDRTIDPLMVDSWLAQRPFVGVDGRPLSWPDVLGRMGTANADVEVDPPLRVLGVANPRDVERAYNESLRFDEGLVSRAADQLRGDRDVAFDAAYRRSAMDMSIDPVEARRRPAPLRGRPVKPRRRRDGSLRPLREVDLWAEELPAMQNPDTNDYVWPQSYDEVLDLEDAGYVVDPDDERRIDAARPVKFRTETFPVMVDPAGERGDEYPESLSEVEDLRDQGFVEDGDTSIDAVMAPNVYGDRDLVRTRRPSLALNALTGSELLGTVAAMSTADLRVALLSGNLLPQQVSAVREELRLREGEAVAASLF